MHHERLLARGPATSSAFGSPGSTGGSGPPIPRAAARRPEGGALAPVGDHPLARVAGKGRVRGAPAAKWMPCSSRLPRWRWTLIVGRITSPAAIGRATNDRGSRVSLARTGDSGLPTSWNLRSDYRERRPCTRLFGSPQGFAAAAGGRSRFATTRRTTRCTTRYGVAP